MTATGFNFTRKSQYSTDQQVSTIDVKDYHLNITKLVNHSERRKPDVKWDLQPAVVLYHNADSMIGQIMQNGQAKNTSYIMVKIGKIANKKQQRFKEKAYMVNLKFVTESGVLVDHKVPVAEAFDTSDMNMILMLGSRAMAHDALEKAARKMMTTSIDFGLEGLHGSLMNRLSGMLKGNRSSHILVIRSLPVGYQMIFAAAALEATPEQLAAARSKLFARKRNLSKDKDADVTVSVEEMANERKNDSEAKARQAATLLSCLESSDSESGLASVIKIIRFHTNLANAGLTDELDIPENIEEDSKFGKKIGPALCKLINEEKDEKVKSEYKTKALYKIVHKCHKAATTKQFPPDLAMEDFHTANAGGMIKEVLGVLVTQALPLLNPHVDTLALQWVHRQVASELAEAKNDQERADLLEELSVLKAWPENGEAEKVITSVYKRARGHNPEDAEKLVQAVWLNMHAVVGDPVKIRTFLGANDTDAADMFLPGNLEKWSKRLVGDAKPGPLTFQTFPQTREMKKSREATPMYTGGFGTGIMPTYVGKGLEALREAAIGTLTGKAEMEMDVSTSVALDFNKDDVKDIVGGMATVTKDSVREIVHEYSRTKRVTATQSFLIPEGATKVIELGYGTDVADLELSGNRLDKLIEAYDDLVTDSIVVNAKNIARQFKSVDDEVAWAEMLTVFYNASKLMAKKKDKGEKTGKDQEASTSSLDTPEMRKKLTAMRKSKRACGMRSGTVHLNQGVTLQNGSVIHQAPYMDRRVVDVIDMTTQDSDEMTLRMEMMVAATSSSGYVTVTSGSFSDEQVEEYRGWIAAGRDPSTAKYGFFCGQKRQHSSDDEEDDEETEDEDESKKKKKSSKDKSKADAEGSGNNPEQSSGTSTDGVVPPADAEEGMVS